MLLYQRSNIDILKRMKLPDVVINVVWEILINNEVLEQWVVDESLIELLSVEWLVVKASGFVLELLLLDELEHVAFGLPPHEVGHVPALLLSSFEVHQEVWRSVGHKYLSDHLVELKPDFQHPHLHLALQVVDLVHLGCNGLLVVLCIIL